MTERSDRGDRPPGRQPTEGVRIIGAEEAQAALDAGEVAGRRSEDQPRFGDVPPAPAGPRPAHRFPLPDSVDPAEAVPLGRIAPIGDDLWRGDPAGPWETTESTTELGVPPQPQYPESGVSWHDPTLFDPGDESITVTGGGTEMPHWTDPPTGEVPRILVDEPAEDYEEDDLDAWRALGSRGIRWRDGAEDWEGEDEMAVLAGGDDPIGALDQSRSEESDLYSFEEDFERITSSRTGPTPAVVDYDEDYPDEEPGYEREPVARRSRHARSGGHGHGPKSRVRAPARPARPARRVAPKPAGPSGRDDMGSRVAVGIGLIVLLVIAYLVGTKALVVLAAVIIVAALAEAYGMLQKAGFRPATLLGLVASAGMVLGAYWRGIEALPLCTVLLVAGGMMWYVLRIVEARPLANVAVTAMAFCWVGLLGSYASLLLRSTHGRGLFLGVVLVAVAADIVAFLVGRWIGSRPMAATISPNKTIEGFLGGLVGAIIVGAIIGKEVAPWGGLGHGLLLGLVVGLIAPMGDLFESMIKRDLGLKDSGTLLGGHGGLLDRFDAVLLALPAGFYLATLFGVVH